MFGTTSMLTLVTLTGLVAGFAREWLLVASWGAGARTDGFLIAMFLPEALRTMLAAGVLSSGALALWHAREAHERPLWLGQMSAALGLIALALAAVLHLGAPLWVHLVGPGLGDAQRLLTESTLQCLAWSIPGIVMQGLWTVPLQAQGRFLLAGLGSLLYNLPAIAYLGLFRDQATEHGLARAFVLGGMAMMMVMAPSVWLLGLRPGHLRWSPVPLRELGRRLLPLLASGAAGQGLQLLERIAASYLGEGVVTLLNLTRKLINLPLIALMSLNQVLLGLMSSGGESQRVPLLRRGMATVTMVSLPAAVGLMLSAPALVALLFPKVHGTAMLAPLLGWYAVILVVAGWNAMLARYNYASGSTRLPLGCELWGNALQALSLPLLAWLWGAPGIVVSTLLGALLTCFLLLRRNRLWQPLALGRQMLSGAAMLAASGWWVAPMLSSPSSANLALSALVAVVCLLVLAVFLTPWREPQGAS